MKKITVDIPYNASLYVEKLFIEYNSLLNILKYLCSKDSVKQQHLDKYFEEAAMIATELELAKKETADIYKPCNYSSFNFLFEDNAIEYGICDGICEGECKNA